MHCSRRRPAHADSKGISQLTISGADNVGIGHLFPDNLADPDLLETLGVQGREDADNGHVIDALFLDQAALLSDLGFVDGQDFSRIV